MAHSRGEPPLSLPGGVVFASLPFGFRPAESQEDDIQVGTPSLGNTHFCRTNHAKTNRATKTMSLM